MDLEELSRYILSRINSRNKYVDLMFEAFSKKTIPDYEFSKNLNKKDSEVIDSINILSTNDLKILGDKIYELRQNDNTQ